jgi:dUTP pyrophosphatase
MKIRIVNNSRNPLPKYETAFSAGMDLMASLDDNQTIVLKPGERKLIKTDLFIELPEEYEAQIRSRSGLALKRGVVVLNSPGTIN